jgi:CRP/FNR family transcriptional regulator
MKRRMADLPDRCARCAVRDEALCASLHDDELSALNDMARRRTLAKGEVVAWAGDRSTVCANIVSGVLKLSASMPDGREQIVGLLFAGDFLGDPFAEDVRLTATALGDTDLCIYPRSGFERVLAGHPKLERMLLRRTMDSLEQARARMLTLGRRSASEKVAGFLLDMSARVSGDGGSGATNGFDLPISRGQIADVLGLTIETVSRQMTTLKVAGIVRLAGRSVVILDQAALAARAGAE